MATQFDFESAFDITGLSGLTKSQLIQYVLKLGPLSNIGGIIVMSGLNNAHPDVTNNPRFARYLWIDNQDADAPVLKLYAPASVGSDAYTDWVNSALANGTVTAEKLAQYAVTILAANGQKNIAYRFDQIPDNTKTLYLLRLDANGQYVEVVSAADVINSQLINPAKIDPAGATNGMLLQYDATVGYVKFATVNFSSAVADGTLALSKLAYGDAGQAGYLVRVNPVAPYNIQLVVNNDLTGDLFAIRSLRLNRLDVTGATTGDKVRFDGTNWVVAKSFYGAPTSGGTTIPSPNGGGQLLVAHGLGAAPKRYGISLVCTVDDAGYVAGTSDTVNGLSLIGLNSGGTELAPAISLYVNATNIVANFYNGNGAGAKYRLINNVDFLRGATANLTPGSWNVFFWAEL